jgi:Flp pilus assembly pilin Flp
MKPRLGATATETLILVVLVTMVVLASIKVLRDTMGDKADEASTRVASVTTEKGDEDRQERASWRDDGDGAVQGESGADQEAAGQGGSQDSDTVARGPGGLRNMPDGTDSTPAAHSEGGCGGFNPFLIPIILGLLGLLGYVITKAKKA